VAAEIGAESAWLVSVFLFGRGSFRFFLLLSGNGLKLSGRSLGWNQLSLHFRSVGLPRFRGSVVRRFLFG
jgi:hypothetical protein